MFEIGSSLREARLRRGLTLADAESKTKIRAKYLAALEDERFDILPGDAYAKGFLHTYAEFLGLRGSLYVDEFNERFGASEEPDTPPPRRSGGGFARLLDTRVAVAAAIVAAIAGLVWLGSGGPTDGPQVAAGPPPSPRRTTAPPPPPPPPPTPRRRPPTLVLAAARGDCWLSVRVGSGDGKLVYEQTLAQGRRVVFGLKRPLWIRLGAPANLVASVAGKRVALPTATADVVASRSGVQPAPPA